MAELITIRLDKTPGSSWGFRLHGGKDFASPLCIQKVNQGSIAESAGLKPGDIIISISGTDTSTLRHKDAQDVIMNSGNNFDVVIQRGSQIWKPQVTPLPEPTMLPGGIPVATKTSLAANQKSVRYIGMNHNIVPKPYPGSPVISNKTSPLNHTESQVKMENIKNTIKSMNNSKKITEVSSKEYIISSDEENKDITNGFSSSRLGIRDDLLIPGTNVSINKQKARDFLLLTFDKENVERKSDFAKKKSLFDTDNIVLKSSNSLNSTLSLKSSKSSSLSSIGQIRDSSTNRHRKNSLSSNCSSLSNPSSQDEDIDSYNLSSNTLAPSTYNSPINLYSDENIRQTLSAHAEVLDKGVVGVNFMKNEKAYDGHTSDVLRMVQEMDMEPREASRTPTDMMGHHLHNDTMQSHSFNILRRTLNDDDEQMGVDRNDSPVTRSVEAPRTNPHSGETGQSAHPGAPIECFVCERPVTGVFVRVKNKNIHEECFKCCTCGSSLKNAGYYNINEKFYCDIHAKQAAMNNPPAPHLEPVTVPPGRAPPVGAMTTMQAMNKQNFSNFRQTNGTSYAPGPAPFSPAGDQSAVDGRENSQELPQFTNQPPSVNESEGVRFDQPAVRDINDREVESLSDESKRDAFIQQNKHSPSIPSYSSPAPAPAPAPFMPSSNFGQSESPFATAPKNSFSPSFTSFNNANPQGFGAPAGNINVKGHIPRKGDVSIPTNFDPPSMGPSPVPGLNINPMGKPTPPQMGGGNTKGIRQALGQRTAPRRGKGIMNQACASRIPMCAACQVQIRGPFVSALGKTWCPDHFVCGTSTCRQPILEMGFVEEKGSLYCEICYENYLAPICGKCEKRIKGDCLNAVGKQFHPDCFCCAYCGKIFGSGAFYLEDGLPYCETDWNDLFTTKCVGCNFPIEAGDRWVEALNNNYHSQCFKCTKCNKNLEGQSFFAKGGKPFCKAHAQRGI